MLGPDMLKARHLHGKALRRHEGALRLPATVSSRSRQLKTLHAALSNTSSATTPAPEKSRTQTIMERVDALQASSGQAGGAGGRTTYQAFKGLDQAWSQLRNMAEGSAAGPAPQFVRQVGAPLAVAPRLDYDVAVCGGTLGIVAAAALAARGFRVVVVERGPLRGREQEWNISRKELAELVELGVLTAEEVDACVSIEFNPVRIGFHGGVDVWTEDVLNIGVSPARLIQKVRAKFEDLGGVVLEGVAIDGIAVHPDGAKLTFGGGKPGGQPGSSQGPLTCRLVLDCMGHASPVVKQLRWGVKPDGVCIVVGAMGSGFDQNSTGDVIATIGDLSADRGLQYFWEAFPTGSGPKDRTTYMFSYLDAESYRPSMEKVMEDYWDLMPRYQNVDFDSIEFKRVLFGYFPTFRDSPLQPGFDRILQIGDASGIQSPLSFGGFGALTRHLGRLTVAVSEALEADVLDKGSLSLIHAYNPGLSSAWMLQRAMSVRPSEAPPTNLINRMLSGNFSAMQKLGDPVMKPFLQDVIQFGPLLQTMGAQLMQDPLSIPQLLVHVGPGPLADWMKHVAGLGAFSALYQLAGSGPLGSMLKKQKLSPAQRFRLNRLIDAWEFGSGKDYKM